MMRLLGLWCVIMCIDMACQGALRIVHVLIYMDVKNIQRLDLVVSNFLRKDAINCLRGMRDY